MKITCQACQSKYTIADDKIQGKVAKIRCRKCGATVLVDASVGGASPVNGASVGYALQSTGPVTWSVAIGEGNPHSMTLSEVVDAYNTGVITGETYVWKDGMVDWVMLAQSEEIVTALRGAAAIAEPPTQLRPTSAAAGGSERPGHAHESRLSAFGTSGGGQDEGVRSRAVDPFRNGPVEEEEEVATSVPSNVVARMATTVGTKSTAATGGGAVVSTTSTSGSTTGSRDEQSLLFSLAALTSGNASNHEAVSTNSPPKKNDEDSGLIDLNALAKAQASQKAATPAADAGLFPAPFMFPAALGNVEVPAAEAVDIPPMAARKKSKAPLFVGLGAAAVGVIALVAFAGSQKPAEPAAPAASAIEAISTPETLATRAPEPTPPPAAPSAAPPSEPKKLAAGPRPRGAKHGDGASVGAGAPPPAAAPAAPAPVRNKCGCATGDLQCRIRCSATGK